MITFGAGFNSAYLSNDHGSSLEIPSFLTHIELGLSEYSRWVSQKVIPEVDLSLHLSRTPVTEPSNVQDSFIKYVHERTAADPGNLSSIGIHLVGPRNIGIGKLGFSSHYTPSKTVAKNAMRFIEKLRTRVDLPIWIENANFYSGSLSEIFKTWESIKDICRNTDAGLIIDLSHLIIDSRNNGILPTIILGAVPWEYVVEIHLSGIIEASDGSFHDGHSQPVYNLAWELLDQCLQRLIPDTQPIVITIEHTDPCWSKKQDTHNADFLKLKNIVEAKKNVSINRSDQAYKYAHGYLKKLLKQWIPQLVLACDQKGLSFDTLFDDWLNQVIQQEGRRIVLTSDESPPEEINGICIATQEFLKFSKNRLGKC